MSVLSPLALLTWLVAPTLFAGVLLLVRARVQPEDKSEKQALVAMVLPFVVGLIVLPFAPSLPVLGPELPLGIADYARGGSFVAERAPQGPSRSWAHIGPGFLGLYGIVALCRLGAVLRARRALLNLAPKGAPSNYGDDVVLSSDISAPIVDERGFVLLPRELGASLTASEAGLIIAHERAHHHRGDPRYFIVLALIDAVFWLHPIIRHQTARCRLAAEIACDEAACADSYAQRKAYAALIVKTLKHAAGNALPCAPAVFSPRTKGEFGMRLTQIMRPRTKRGKGRLGAALTVFAAALGATQVALAQQARSFSFSVAPVEFGRITSPYGERVHPVDKTTHNHRGTDIAAPLGTPIRAPGPGVVSRMEVHKGYGNFMEVSHAGGVVTRFAQLDSFEAEIGDRVIAGETIARLGSSGRSTGPHLHLEVFVDGERVDPQTLIPMPAGIRNFTPASERLHAGDKPTPG